VRKVLNEVTRLSEAERTPLEHRFQRLLHRVSAG
jgi:hypothetical protein